MRQPLEGPVDSGGVRSRARAVAGSCAFEGIGVVQSPVGSAVMTETGRWGLMDRHAWIDERLRQVPIFQGLSEKQLRQISSLMTRIDRAPGTVLIEEGRVGNEFFIVLEGKVEVTLEGVAERPRISGRLHFLTSVLVRRRSRSSNRSWSRCSAGRSSRACWRRHPSSQRRSWPPWLDVSPRATTLPSLERR